MEVKPIWIVTVGITAVVLILTNISVLPIQWTNSLETSQSSTGSTNGYQQTWTLLNSSNLEDGSTASGNATFQGFRYQMGNPLPQLYVLSPSQYTTWVGATSRAVPTVSTQSIQPIIDFQNNIISFKFRFDVKEPGTYYFVMISTNLAPLPYPYKPSADLTYSATSASPPLWVRLLGLAVPILVWLGNKARDYRFVPTSKKKSRA